MAKPKHGTAHHVLPRPPRIPSPAVLSALAVIATVPPVVAGSPLPPPHPPAFLCPFIERDVPSVDTPSRLGLPPVPSSPSKCDVVADKYTQGSDSLWRKTEKWTLYGSTCWSSLTPDAQSQPSSSQAFTPASTSSPNDFDTSFDTSALPAGWDSATSLKSSTESTIILALAIILAGSICSFMIGCVIWRRRKKRARDIEHKLGQKRGAQDRSQDTRGKMRIWAKATARWKSNIRHSARRRRKRLCASSTTNRPSSPSPSESPQLSLIAPSAPSRRSSIASEESSPSGREAVLSRDGNVTEPSVVLHCPPRSTSPPTYRASCVLRPPLGSAIPTPSTVGPDSVQCSDHPPFAELLPYIPPSDGHVATDDKSQLAYIQQLASSPSMTVDAASPSAVQPVSAPEWHEVEDSLEDLGIHLSNVPASLHDFALPPFFPPPPSTGDIPSPFGYLDDLRLHYGDGDDASLSIPTPGFPLGAFPSVPPIDDPDPGLEPSAPSLEGEDELCQDWDGASSYVPEVSTSVDLDSVPAPAIESPLPLNVSSASRGASFSSTAGDGILPRYHP